MLGNFCKAREATTRNTLVIPRRSDKVISTNSPHPEGFWLFYSITASFVVIVAYDYTFLLIPCAETK